MLKDTRVGEDQAQAIASHSNAGYGNDKLVVRYDPGRAKGQGDRPKPTLPAMIF